MTQQTITALFDSRADAADAVERLVDAGIPRTSIRITPDADDASASDATTPGANDTRHDARGFWASLGDMFIPDDDRHTYAQAMHRGSIMVGVTTDETHADRAEDILERYGTVDLDEREASYRREGSLGATATTLGAVGSEGLAEGEEVIPLVEERLVVGKRQVGRGRVKVRSYVVETPVDERVSLRTETVHLERRPVDRPAAVGEDAFRDRTFETSAVSEEAVVSKQARVTGEVRVEKDVEERTEVVSDTVRSTEVEVDDDRAASRRPARDTPQI